MDKFLEKYNFTELNQEEIENLNRCNTSTEIKTIIRNIPAKRKKKKRKKTQDQMASG